jgi:hypothetical protein
MLLDPCYLAKRSGFSCRSKSSQLAGQETRWQLGIAGHRRVETTAGRGKTSRRASRWHGLDPMSRHGSELWSRLRASVRLVLHSNERAQEPWPGDTLRRNWRIGRVRRPSSEPLSVWSDLTDPSGQPAVLFRGDATQAAAAARQGSCAPRCAHRKPDAGRGRT